MTVEPPEILRGKGRFRLLSPSEGRALQKIHEGLEPPDRFDKAPQRKAVEEGLEVVPLGGVGIAGGKKRQKGRRSRGGIVPDPFVHEAQKGQKERPGGPEDLVEEDEGALGDPYRRQRRGGEGVPVALHVEEPLVVGEAGEALRGQPDDETFPRARGPHQVEVLAREKGQHHRPDHLPPLLEAPVQILLQPSELLHDQGPFDP